MQQPVPHNKARARRRWAILIAVLALLGWLALGHGGKEAGPGGGKGGMRMQTPIVTLTPAARRDVPVYLDGLGTVQASNTVTVHAQIDGQLQEIAFAEGQDVKTGDVLAKIDPRTFKAAYDQAVAAKGRDVAQLENAKRDLERYASLGDAISAQTTDTQRATVRQLAATVASDQAAIDSAKTQLGYTTITSPIDGRTGLRQVDVGNIVHPGDANGIVVVTQLQPIAVLFSLPQQDLQQITTEQAKNEADSKLTVLATDAAGKTIDTGTLELIDNQIDQGTGTIKLKALLPNEQRQMWPGGFVNVRLLLKTLPNALTVPAPAVQHGPQGTYVFLFNDADKTVKMQPVTVLQSADEIAVITEGLKDGDRVVTDGAGKLQDGAKVALPDTTAGDAPAAKPEDHKRKDK